MVVENIDGSIVGAYGTPSTTAEGTRSAGEASAEGAVDARAEAGALDGLKDAAIIDGDGRTDAGVPADELAPWHAATSSMVRTSAVTRRDRVRHDGDMAAPLWESLTASRLDRWSSHVIHRPPDRHRAAG
jgi:hypothetical protein